MLGTATLKNMNAIVDLTTDKFKVGRKFSSPVDNWQHVHSDNISRFTILGTERREAAQTAGFRHNEPSTPNPQEGRGVESQIYYLNYQIALGASTAPRSNAHFYLGICIVLTHLSKQTQNFQPNDW